MRRLRSATGRRGRGSLRGGESCVDPPLVPAFAPVPGTCPAAAGVDSHPRVIRDRGGAQAPAPGDRRSCRHDPSARPPHESAQRARRERYARSPKSRPSGPCWPRRHGPPRGHAARAVLASRAVGHPSGCVAGVLAPAFAPLRRRENATSLGRASSLLRCDPNCRASCSDNRGGTKMRPRCWDRTQEPP